MCEYYYYYYYYYYSLDLGVRVVHLEVGDDDGDGEGDGEHAADCAQAAHDHAQVRLGDYVAIAHRSHGD